MANVQNILHTLQSAKLRKSILENSDIHLIKTLIECIQNTLNGNVTLTKNEIKKLRRFKTVLRKILHSKCKLEQKRKLIIQSGQGAFFPILLAPIVLLYLTFSKNEACKENEVRGHQFH